VNVFQSAIRAATRRRAPPICLAACLIGASPSSGGCRSASPPELPGFDAALETIDGGNAGNAGWTDTIVAFVDPASGATVSCTADLPACGIPAPGCGADGVLGPADGQTFALVPGANILVAFRCASILGHAGGEAAADFVVWANVAAGGSGIVEVSPDGAAFASVGMLTQSDQSFSIARVGAPVEKFVRISNAGASDILLDAIEAR
jgi:hypothetical protein